MVLGLIELKIALLRTFPFRLLIVVHVIVLSAPQSNYQIPGLSTYPLSCSNMPLLFFVLKQTHIVIESYIEFVNNMSYNRKWSSRNKELMKGIDV